MCITSKKPLSAFLSQHPFTRSIIFNMFASQQKKRNIFCQKINFSLWLSCCCVFSSLLHFLPDSNPVHILYIPIFYPWHLKQSYVFSVGKTHIYGIKLFMFVYLFAFLCGKYFSLCYHIFSRIFHCSSVNFPTFQFTQSSAFDFAS